ncbi:MAG: NfeD family protein [Oscillospiraceae bacterium]|jgi:membrane protein implicated in regulation of membrane protease activity|nr:NfeD family protein [Oscillospiraceae bacterium]
MILFAVIWLALAVALAALEAVTAQFVSVWFSLGAVAAMLLALSGADIRAQILVFTAVSAILVAALRPLSRKLARRPGRTRPAATPTNADRAVGATAEALRDIGNGDAGQVKINGLVWSAVTPESAGGAVIRAGERVRVLAIEGAKLIVEKDEIQSEVK